MDTQELIRQAEAMRTRIRQYAKRDKNGDHGEAAKAQVCEFLRIYAGPKSAFFKQAEAAGGFANYLVTWGYSLYSSPYYRLWWRFFFRPRIPLTIAA